MATVRVTLNLCPEFIKCREKIVDEGLEVTRRGTRGDLMAAGLNEYRQLQLQGGYQEGWQQLQYNFDGADYSFPTEERTDAASATAYRPLQPSVVLTENYDVNQLCRSQCGQLLSIVIPSRRSLNGIREIGATMIGASRQEVAHAVARAVQQRGFRGYVSELSFAVRYKDGYLPDAYQETSDAFELTLQPPSVRDQSYTSLACRSLGMFVGGDWPRYQYSAHSFSQPIESEDKEK